MLSARRAETMTFIAFLLIGWGIARAIGYFAPAEYYRNKDTGAIER